MNLPMRSIEFDAVLKKPAGEILLEAIPTNSLPDSDKMLTVNIASPEEIKASFSYVQPLCVKPLDDGTWEYCNNKYDEINRTDRLVLPGGSFLEGDKYVELSEGLYFKKNNDEKVRISNARIRVIGIREQWESKSDYKRILICQILCKAWAGGVKTVEVPVEEYKQLYRVIQQKYPEISLSTPRMDALDDYLTDVFQNKSTANLQQEICTTRSGWMTLYGKARYYIGRDPFYSSYEIPDVKMMDKYYIFKEGSSFLKVGNGNMAITLIMLIAHIAYSLFWFRKGAMDFRSVLFLKGGTNLLKTSVVREVANVFDTNRNHAVIRIASTLASVQHNICMLRDQLVCLDDFSNTEKRSKNKAVEAAEDAIRAVGDGAFPIKMSLKDAQHVSRNTVRSALILTGEEDLGLGLSSNYRTIVVPVTEGTFDGDVLTEFQQNPAILRRYFALYVAFLTEYGEELAHCCQQEFPKYRQEYKEILKVPRFIDAAAGLRVQVYFLIRFAAYCGVADVEQNELMTMCEERIVEAMQQNQQASVGKKPEIRFLYALMQSIGTGQNNGLAEDETQYVLDEAKHIGFYEKTAGLIWIRWEAAWSLVESYYRMQNEDWLVKTNTIKELLLKKGISDGKKMPEGKAGNEYLRKARKGARKRMLVLRQHIVEKLLEAEEEF